MEMMPMSDITLKAHFDGKHILLDEPFYIPVNTELSVIVPSPFSATDTPDSERRDWLHVASSNLARAYSDDEPEYTLADVKP
jgi:hypothetical protein